MNSDTPFQLTLDADKKTSESIYMQIRQMILKGELEPGSRLPSERKLTEMLQRSRSAIREALQMLEREGYIRKIPKSSGAIVQLPGMEPVVETLGTYLTTAQLDIEEILEFRRITETYGAQLAAERRTDEQLQILAEILEESRQSFGNPQAFVDCDLRFHMTIAESAGNSLFVIMLNVCRNILGARLNENITKGSESVRQDRYQSIYNCHKTIYHAIQEKNGALAYQEMEAHLTEAKEDILHI